MADRKTNSANKTGRKMTLFFNREARRNAADTLKKAAWLMAAGAGALGYSKGSVAYVAVVVIGWITCQTLATLILSIEERSNDGPESPAANEEHGRTARAARKLTRR